MIEHVMVPQQTVGVSSLQPYYVFSINNERTGNALIPHHCELLSLIIKHVPETLESIDLICGGSKIKTYGKEDIMKGENLLPVDYASMSYFYYTDIHFRYDTHYIESNEIYEMMEEYKEEEQLSDNETEYFDGHNYFSGRRVNRKVVPTGTKKKIIEEAKVIMPELQFTIFRPYGENLV
jgi:hypothetical protein